MRPQWRVAVIVLIWLGRAWTLEPDRLREAEVLVSAAQVAGEGAAVNAAVLVAALDTLVEATNAKASSNALSQLAALLGLVLDERERLTLFEHAAQRLSSEEDAGILAVNLAEASAPGGGFPPVQEAFLWRSLELYPDHPLALRQLGFNLEQFGREAEALALYEERLRADPGRRDLRLLAAAVCSPHLESAQAAAERYRRVSLAMAGLVQELRGGGGRAGAPQIPPGFPARYLLHMPSYSWQYLGYNMRPLMESLCAVLVALAPRLREPVPHLDPEHGWPSTVTSGGGGGGGGVPPPPHLPPSTPSDTPPLRAATAATAAVAAVAAAGGAGQAASDRTVITLGVVLEKGANRSPHRLLEGVLAGLDRSRFRVVAFAHGPAASLPPPARAVLAAADRAEVLPWDPGAEGVPDTWGARRVIAEARVDVLLYMALGNTLGSHLLAQGRLAPVQASFGHGHPVTAGTAAVDYFLSSSLFETPAGDRARRTGRSARAGTTVGGVQGQDDKRLEAAVAPAAATAATAEVFILVANGSEGGSYEYSHWQGHGEDGSGRLAGGQALGAGGGRGDGAQEFTEQLVLFDSLSTCFPAVERPSAQEVAAAVAEVGGGGGSFGGGGGSGGGGVEDGGGGGGGQDAHLYHLMQHSKKLHPDMDGVLRGVLATDPQAHVLLLEGSKVHLPRWRRTLGPELTRRLVFVPYRPHRDMLALVAACHVMLDSFPWGAGVTVFEALSLGIPVVTLPSRVSVLQLATGQAVQLGLEEHLVARNDSDMVTKAVRLATCGPHRANVSEEILRRRSRLFEQRDAVVTEWEGFLERAVRLGLGAVAAAA